MYSFTHRKAVDDLEILKSTNRSHVAAPVDFQVEYLASQHFETPGYEKNISEALTGVYGVQKIDLVIAVYYPALNFTMHHRDQILPGVPIVFSSGALGSLGDQKLWSGMTGVTMNADVRGTIDLALRLQPDAKDSAVVAGTSEFDRYWSAQMNRELQQSNLKVINLAGLPPDQLLKAVAALPAHTIVFFHLMPEEAAQPVIGTYESLAAIAQQFQTYSFVGYCLSHGATGGSYPDPVEQGQKVGELAARVLSGEEPEDVPILPGPPALAHVDWRQLRHWNIPESALPPGAIVSYRQPRAVERYARYVGDAYDHGRVPPADRPAILPLRV